ncbi:hypothetical protein EN833_31225 [Mesorhizobium sp. M4B.F.Ca.ET.190.01.1.1]|uniref:macro domain-containing protein n=1 Tax=unclassified Mesorhizobium TaxID=325217 RepID=UPI000FE56211|nr:MULTISPECIES: macro domain-containing protein [unclassified Mesorhizobium]RWA58786.1 MAG: hypothetical protein EOQ27_28605 [Mesorhizobium sp.]RWF63909.1 MAG: hypothetical protein EOS47_17200 [Mesorhizobium sp.]TGR00815.1 hypothetical protein EN843_31220 [Mesorhizobium sp. M4B.F.Ca.ET.200.01.1.1]TGS12592.1 hypothetical protein EN833_31225 [Mesorhizobium sp. M4B.F.Ca.ET.190.01.1.1]TGT24824.1 hypothetical protein EN815_31210 [Mesorhizobium sp. M4B.F.Ca.ET.172.01.1.1]
MITFVQGDIFSAPVNIRVNTVNCVGVMGAGMALAFKQRYPAMFKEYQQVCRADELRPGRLHVWRSLEGDWIINFPTKRDWRESSYYEDIDAGLDALHDYLKPLGAVSVAVPALGCGHGGLDWGRVSKMIEEKLGDLPANLLVFAPSDSRRAGHSAVEEITTDEMHAVEKIGYKRLSVSDASWPSDRVVLAKGNIEHLDQRWIALLPSRSPGERELFALHSVAAELARCDVNVSVALVHGSRTTEEIADVFISHGVDVVMLLPFGVLTRKKLSQIAVERPSGTLTLVSAAPPNQKWSRQYFAEAMDILRARAGAILLTDPEPDWLNNRRAAWQSASISFLRYNPLPGELVQALESLGAQPIGRHPGSGAPNLSGLLAPWRSAPNLPSNLNSSSDGIEPSSRRQKHIALDLLAFRKDQLPVIVQLIRETSPREMRLSIEFENELVASELEQRLELLKQQKD